MTNVHSVRPTDLVALAAFDGRVYPNEAVTLDRTGAASPPHLLEAALDQWFSFATGRHTWISVKGATLRGLASARRRGSKAAWELDCLIHAADDDSGVLMSLLDQVAADAGDAGAEKVFLRVASDSAIAKTAARCGFTPFLVETLMAAQDRRNDEEKQEGSDDRLRGRMRRWRRADAHATFRLYNVWAPERVRRQEAATFREWQAARQRLSPPRGASQRVLEQEGRVAGWLRTAAVGELGRFDLMADPTMPELLDTLIDAALRRLSEQSSLLTVVPEFAPGLAERLQRRGFAEQARFLVLARRTTKTLRLPRREMTVQMQSFPA